MPRIAVAAMLATAAALALTAGTTAAQDRVFLIRHAEKADGHDPALTEAGRGRAARWAAMLAPAGIDHVWSSDARRTMETAGIVAGALGLGHDSWPATDVTGLVDLLGFDHEGETILIVAHTETIPAFLAAYGAARAEIAEDDFASLFVVIPGAASSTVATHLRMP